MKYRVDFVTNSSSDSFFHMNHRFSDGTEDYWDTGEFPELDVIQTENGLERFDGSKVKTAEELCAILLFDLHDDMTVPDLPVEALSALFLFIIGKTDCSMLIEQIKSLETAVDADGEAFGDYYDFSILDDINTEDDNDKNAIFNEILDIFQEENVDFDEEIIQYVKEIYEKSTSLLDFSLIEAVEDFTENGEFLPYDYDLWDSEINIEDDFYQMSKEDPLFEKECTRWTEYTKVVFGIDGIDRENIYPERSLTKGDYTYLAGIGSDYSSRHKYFYYFPNGINGCLKSFCTLGEIPDNKFFTTKASKETNIEINTLVIPEQIKRIGRNAFRNCSIKTVCFPKGLTEIGAYAFDGSGCEITEIPESIEKIGLTLVWEILKYAVNHKILDIQEWDIFWLLEYEADHQDSKYLNLLAENGYIPNHFPDYPITDLLDKAVRIGFDEYIDLLLSARLELDYSDVAHYIYNDSLETLYPLFDKGLKIDPSAYDDLITYASEHGKPEYTAWLLNRKNENEQRKNTND